MAEILYSDKGRAIQVRLDEAPPPALAGLLERTIWGESGVVYTVHGIGEILGRLAQPSFLSLMVGDQLAGAAVRNRKTVEIGSTVYDAFNLALLAVHPTFARRGYGKLLAGVSRRHYMGELNTPGLLYGYIESGNRRSLQLNLDIGYRRLGRVHSTTFSRLRPRIDPSIQGLAEHEQSRVLALLSASYADHSLRDFEQSLIPADYHVVREGNDIIAGAQAHVLHWSLKQLPGLKGLMVAKVLPHLPLIGRHFTTGDLRFLYVGNIYARQGAETALFQIFETLLARYHVPFALIFMDSRSAVFQRIMAGRELGLFNRGIEVVIDIIAEFKGVAEKEIERICQTPLCVSPIDPL